MPFFNRFSRSRRSQPGSNHPLFQDDINQKNNSFRKRSETADYPRAAKSAPSSRVRAASAAHPANKALVAKVLSVNKPKPVGAVIPDVIPSQENQAPVQVVNAQINAAVTKAMEKPTTKPTQESIDALKDRLAIGNRKKRTSSFTKSESEAVGTLDDVLRVFDSIDDNFDEVAEEVSEPKTTETMNDDILKDAEEKIKTIDYTEQVYAKPMKSSKPTTPTEKSEVNAESILNPLSKIEPDELEGPVVPPKLFATEEHDIKFSELRKTPSMALSQSLKETDWADANAEISSPNRRLYPSAVDSNNNYSLKRGKLSAPNESTEDYIKPPPDYDMNGTMSSISKSMSISEDSITTRDNWMGSLSSSSGSRKEPKPIRPELLDLIRENKSKQVEGDAKRSPDHDGLVKHSFRRIRQAAKDRESESPEDRAKEIPEVCASEIPEVRASEIPEVRASEIPESNYVAIKDEADKWLANNGHLRANSPQAKNHDSTATNSSASGSPQRKVPGPENGAAKPKSESLKIDSTPLKSDQRRPFKPKSKSSKKEVATDDENLVHLMETGVSPENTSSIVSASQEPTGWTYVPRALRMSYGPTWDGIRKDRRAWKSKEINGTIYPNARKGSKKLSSRLHEQNYQMEMLF